MYGPGTVLHVTLDEVAVRIAKIASSLLSALLLHAYEQQGCMQALHSRKQNVRQCSETWGLVVRSSASGQRKMQTAATCLSVCDSGSSRSKAAALAPICLEQSQKLLLWKQLSQHLVT